MLKWATLPPIIAAGTIFLARLLGEGTRGAAVDLSIWVMGGLSFIILSWLYGLFIIHSFPGLIALQCVAQGILFCLLSLEFGARMVPWVGVVMTISGAAALVSEYHVVQLRGARIGMRRVEEVEEAEEAEPEPAEEPEPEPEPEPAPAEETPAPGLDAPGLLDPFTHLHPFRYALFRLEEELYRARRYGHPLSAILFRFVFPEAAEQDGTALAAFNAYCGVLKGGLRASDTVTLADPRTFLFAFPECPASSLEAVVQRLFTFADALCPNFPVLYEVTPLHVTVSFEGTEELPTARALMDQLSGDLAQKYSPNLS